MYISKLHCLDIFGILGIYFVLLSSYCFKTPDKIIIVSEACLSIDDDFSKY